MHQKCALTSSSHATVGLLNKKNLLTFSECESSEFMLRQFSNMISILSSIYLVIHLCSCHLFNPL